MILSSFAGIAVLALLALIGAGDRRPAPGRVVASRAAAAPEARLVPEFVRFGWVSPPVDSTSAARVAEMAGCGLDLMLPAWADSGRAADNLARLAFAEANGLRVIAWDRRFDDVRFDTPATLAALDSVVADYRDEPAFLAYYFEDEPPPERFSLFARYHAELRARDPLHFSFDNLRGRNAFPTRAAFEAYVNAWADSAQPAVLCDDQYDFAKTGDIGLFVENAAVLGAIARARGLPFWIIVQLVEHGPFRAITPGELSWQAGMSLAYGARGIGYFTYWTPAPDPQWNWQPAVIGYDGARSPWYDAVRSLNARVGPVGRTLARSHWLGAEHAGSVPVGGTPFAADGVVQGVAGRAALGWFADSTGRLHVLVVNADSSAARTIELETAIAPDQAVESLDPALDAWQPVPFAVGPRGRQSLALDLPAGGFALVRFPPSAGELLATGRGPALRARPTPAAGTLELAVDRAGERARLEILDAAGRRVWGRDLAPGGTTLVWGGERERGGPAGPGVYFARVEDARGMTAVRVVWLGAR